MHRLASSKLPFHLHSPSGPAFASARPD